MTASRVEAVQQARRILSISRGGENVSTLRIYRRDKQQFSELSVTVDFFFFFLTVCVRVTVYTLYICIYEYCKCCFYVFLSG